MSASLLIASRFFFFSATSFSDTVTALRSLSFSESSRSIMGARCSSCLPSYLTKCYK